jgi:hypothetical protein
MNANKGLTRVDAIIAIACVALVLAQAGIINAGGRERTKRELCLANLRMLTAAWQMYADDNAGKLVNGAPQNRTQCPDCPAGPAYMCKAAAPSPSDTWNYARHGNEIPWVGPAYGATNDLCRKCAIDSGALWKYVNDYNIYRCPVGNKGEMITYVIVDAANGLPRNGTEAAGVWLKNGSQIIKPASRFVFIDEGYISPDSYGVYYNQQMWFDLPPVRHESGTCVSFADGHSAYHKWKAQETISIGNSGAYNVPPVTCDAKNDLYWVQIGCWGKLGYVPSCPINLE